MSDGDTVEDWRAPALEEARDHARRAIQQYADELARQRGDDAYLVTDWLIVFEATNVELEQADKALREVIVPTTQGLSAAVGLAAFAANRWI